MSANLNIIKLTLLSLLALLLVSCGGGSSSSISTTSSTYNGVAQKGPFAIGSKIVITELDANGVATGVVIQSQVNSKNGSFSFAAEQSNSNNYYRIQASGRFLDEHLGNVPENEITLTAITSNPDNSSINVLTHWLSLRIDTLLVDGKSLTQSLAQAETELTKLFGIFNPSALDITKSSNVMDEDNAMLLLLSGALMEASAKYDLNSQIIITEIGADFADDGLLNEKGDDWFIRLQALIKDNPQAHIKKYAKTLNDKLGSNIAYKNKLPKLVPLASRPVANVPPELLAQPSETITLDGSASNDGGNVINFTWFRVDQQTQYDIQVSDRFSATPTITVPDEETVLAAPNQEISLLYALVVTDVEKLTHTAVVKVTIRITPDVNNPPVAESQSLITNEDTPIAITLTANDIDGDDINFVLSTPLSTPNGIVDLNTDLPNIIYTPTQNYFGTDSFTFLVNDGFENSNVATVDIQVNPVNDPPEAEAGNNQTVQSMEVVNLDGSASFDVDGTVDAYLWTQQASGSLVGLSDSTVSNPSFTAPGVTSISETLRFDLIVTDNNGADSTADTVEITINPLNQAPVAIAGLDQINISSGSLVTLDGSGSSDVDGTVVGYSWVQNGTPSVVLSNASSSNPSFTAPIVSTGSLTLTFDLIVRDNDGALSDVDSVEIVVNPPVNNQPVARAGPDQTVNSISVVLGSDTFESTEFTLDGSASSDIEDIPANLTYNWTFVSGPISVDPDNVTMPVVGISGISNQDIDDDYVFRLVVIDSAGLASDPDEVTISVRSTTGNLRPNANAGPDRVEPPLTQVNLFGSGSDPDGFINGYEWTQVSGTPVFVSGRFSPIARINTPNVLSAPEQLVFQLIVTDNDGLDSLASLVTITVDPSASINNPPTANSYDVFLNQDTAVTITDNTGEIGGMDIDGDPLSVIDVSQPNDGVLELGATGLYVYTPDTGFCGTDSFDYRVHDGRNVSAFARVTLNVNCQPKTGGLGDVTIDSSGVGILLSGTDSDGTIASYEIVTPPANGTFSTGFTLPDLLYIPNNTTVPAEDQFTYRVFDNQGFASEPETVDLIVGNRAPVAVSASIASTTITTTIDLNSFASDPDGDPIRFEIIGALPDFPVEFTITSTFNIDGLVGAVGLDSPVSDSFQFRVIDDKGAKSNIATIEVSF